MEFPAKVDLWFLAVFYGGGAAMLLTAPLVWKKTRGTRLKRGALGASLQAVIGVLFVAVAWQASAVRYVLSADGYLDAHGGWPLSGRIASIASITRVEPSRDGRASHAASLDRLRIDYGRSRVVFIAVHDKPGFLDALAARDPDLLRTETGIRRNVEPSP
ncbi:MAG: hypothetical protein HKP27_03455 [Myxococcales bacterium]|nr:hypothetical protein [Myxococcales bacterium]